LGVSGDPTRARCLDADRIKTAVLGDADPASVAAALETVAKTFPVDGLWIGSKYRVYLSGLTQNAVIRLSPHGKLETLVSDSRLQSPDTFTEGPDGAIYISASHINESPSYNHCRSTRKRPYRVFKLPE
jgi:hypothetical protein